MASIALDMSGYKNKYFTHFFTETYSLVQIKGACRGTSNEYPTYVL